MSGLYRVAWRIVETGFEGHGEYMTYDLAKAWVTYGNECFSRDSWSRREARSLRYDRSDDGTVIEHWLEEKPAE